MNGEGGGREGNERFFPRCVCVCVVSCRVVPCGGCGCVCRCVFVCVLSLCFSRPLGGKQCPCIACSAWLDLCVQLLMLWPARSQTAQRRQQRPLEEKEETTENDETAARPLFFLSLASFFLSFPLVSCFSSFSSSSSALYQSLSPFAPLSLSLSSFFPLRFPMSLLSLSLSLPVFARLSSRHAGLRVCAGGWM